MSRGFIGASGFQGLLLLIVLLCACEEDSAIVVPLDLRAMDAEGQPLAEVQIWANGKLLGQTDAEGRLEARIRGVVGKHVTLTRTCPHGFEAEDQSRALRIADTRGVDRSQTAMKLDFECRASQLFAALVVRAPNPVGARLPITVSGQVVGQTDADGVAHVLLRVLPQSTVRVELDTQNTPELLPHNPVRTFQVGETSEILRFDQILEKPAAVKTARSPRPTAKRPHLPMRIR